jgi:NADH:ubiquinone oxidoreductase subunit F (NADH-binding)
MDAADAAAAAAAYAAACIRVEHLVEGGDIASAVNEAKKKGLTGVDLMLSSDDMSLLPSWMQK